MDILLSPNSDEKSLENNKMRGREQATTSPSNVNKLIWAQTGTHMKLIFCAHRTSKVSSEKAKPPKKTGYRIRIVATVVIVVVVLVAVVVVVVVVVVFIVQIT